MLVGADSALILRDLWRRICFIPTRGLLLRCLLRRAYIRIHSPLLAHAQVVVWRMVCISHTGSLAVRNLWCKVTNTASSRSGSFSLSIHCLFVCLLCAQLDPERLCDIPSHMRLGALQRWASGDLAWCDSTQLSISDRRAASHVIPLNH